MKIEIDDSNLSSLLGDLIDSVVKGNLSERLNDIKIERGLRASGHEKWGMFDNDLTRDLELMDILIHSYQNVINDMSVVEKDNYPKMPE